MSEPLTGITSPRSERGPSGPERSDESGKA